MGDDEKSKPPFHGELNQMRRRIADLEAADAELERRAAGLRESEERLRTLIEVTPHGIVEIDTRGNIVASNPAHARILGYRLDELIGMHVGQTVPPQERDRAIAELERNVAEQPEPTLYETQLLRKDGHVIDCEIAWDYKRNGRGELVGFACVVTDVTRRKRFEQALQDSHAELARRVAERTAELESANAALRAKVAETEKAKAAVAESEAKLSRVLENLPDFVIVVDRRARLLYANRSAPGVPVESLVGSVGFSHIREEYLAMCREALQRVFQTGNVEQLEMVSVYDEYLECRLVPLERDKEVSAVMIICTDVTERKKAEQLMVEKRKLSEKLSTVSDLGEALQACLETAQKVSNLECGGIYLVDRESGVDLAVHKGVSRDFAQKVAHYGVDSPIMPIVMTGKPHYHQGPDAPPAVRSHIRAEGLKALAVVPVCYDGEVVACLNLASRYLDELPVSARHSLEAIAATIGGAIARVRAEESLRASEETARALINAPIESLFLIESDGTVRIANTTGAQRLGMTAEELVGRCIYDVLPPDVAERRRSFSDEVMRSGKSIRFLDKRAGRVYVNSLYPVASNEGKVTHLAIYAQDITERKRAEEKVAREQELLRRLFDLRERERKLLSHEIHDGFVQDVVGAKMLLESATVQLRSPSASASQGLDAARELLAKAVAEARRMIEDLRPMIIDERGIVESIGYLLAEEDKRQGLRIEFRHDVHFDRLDPILEGTLFRIAQEALNNVKRHSQSESVEVCLDQQGDTLRLVIRDEGVGFDPAKVPPDRFGLRGIYDRARLFGGRATVDSAPGKGTRVEVELPFLPERGSPDHLPQPPRSEKAK